MNGETWTSLGSLLASLMFIWAMFSQHFPYNFVPFFQRLGHKIVWFFNPYIEITFHEYTRDSFDRGTAYLAIHRYLAVNSVETAKRLKASESARDSETLVLSMDDYEEIVDEYQGVKVWWTSTMTITKGQSISLYPRDDEKRFYTLTFHKNHRDLITKAYLNHVMAEGKAIALRNRRKKLYTNSKQEAHSGSNWTHVVFEHPATFETLALEPEMKKDIMNDLITFTKGKDYYAKVGKAWKRGYLLYGPPGTGKSTMVAAMANLLQYDVYDLELTSVANNTELRKLLINTSGKSIIVIEDIDCSLNLTGQRKNIAEKIAESEDEKEEIIRAAVENGRTGTDGTKVTLSGLLNFIDGLWSACGGERIFVFTTNYLDKLDPALVRRGRMDKHIKMSYCSFEVFKVLAKNYLGIESHVLFQKIEELLGETNMTPADVVENLMPKSGGEGIVGCLRCLISALEDAKVAAAKAEKKEDKLGVAKEVNMKEDVGGKNNVN